MRARGPLVAASAVLLLLAQSALADASCVVATDPAGDQNGTAGPTVEGEHLVPTPADPAFDLQALQLSVVRGELRAVLSTGRSDVEEPVYWHIRLTDDAHRWSLTAVRHRDGTRVTASGPESNGYVQTGGVAARGTVDSGRGRVEIRVRAGELQLRPESELTGYLATAQRTVGYAEGGPAGSSSAMTPYPLDEMRGSMRFRLDRGCLR